MKFVLGVDGGNTKTLALVARDDGLILGTGRAGCGDIYGATSADAAIAEIKRAVGDALNEAGILSAELSASAFSLAGADWPEDFELLENAMRGQGYGRRIVVVNDAMGALRAGSPGNTGVVVACGTGAAVGARHPDGRVWHSSFWQQVQGAEELGSQALRAVYRAELGIDPPTLLTEQILARLGARNVEEILHRMTGRDLPRPKNRRELVRPLFGAADAGDGAARQIILSHGNALGEYAIVAARRVGLLGEPFPLVLTGGVLRHPSPLLRDALVERVRETAPDARAIQSRFEPAAGALLLALDSMHVVTEATLLERLESTLPGAAFFAT
ncbi:MAG TPA: BadF/BadG/BcrA/BcrD ATPase family protein [Anaerolineales bacterium]|jgi:N-acetylglucosamine kinase-like BadF-type ATPase|nr:BadF/BadG/BcrA/BcrD ATPase family protein [Anaerolineales bacterium]